METKKIISNNNHNLSPIGFGCAAIGGYDYGSVDDKNSLNAISEAWNSGINIFDVSDIYGFGNAESILADALGANCKDAIISTKFGLRQNSFGNVVRDCSPKWLEKALHASLERLKIEQIPIYLIHWYDNKTPIDELIDALNKYKDQGKIGRYGACNFSQKQYSEFCSFGGDNVLQLPYSLVDTSNDQLLQNASRDNSSITMTYDVLGRGILTGKYRNISSFSGTDTRSKHKYFRGKFLEKNLKLVKKLEDIGNDYGVSSAQIAIRWVLDMEFVDVTLVGCKTPEQVLTNINVFNFDLNETDKKTLFDLLS